MNEKIKIYSLNISAVLFLSFTCARAVATVIDRITKPDSVNAANVIANAPSGNRIQTIINWDRIINSGFFRINLEPVVTDAGEEAPSVSASPGELKLVGTITGSWEYARAMIRNRNSQVAEIFKINQNVYGYKLVKINDFDITLTSNGQKYKLEMYGDDKADPSNPVPVNQSDAAGAARKISRSISRASIQQKIQGNMDNMLRGLRIGPDREGNEITGYRLITVDPSNVLYDIGARSGDIIKRINGHPASSTEKIFELWKSFNSESKFIIDIQRNGSIFTYDINITD